MTQTEKVQSAIDQLASDPDIKECIKQIENLPLTTQNHYGDYMNSISRLCGNNKQMIKVVGLALIKAGANKNGVVSAVNILAG